ncbi:MAG: hypothetical protein CME16_06180 [Gemmatimonadetes bacterium]|nr:hypothetical protein [Gemmatimonadota bacterium]
MKCIKILYFFSGLFLLPGLPRELSADPEALRDDIGIRKILQLQRGTIRIAKDPRDNALYTLTASGIISRVVMQSEDEPPGLTIARGVLDAATGARVWTRLESGGEMPADVPLDEILAAHQEKTNRFTDPTDGQLYVLAVDGSIVIPPRTVVAEIAEHGILFPAALFIATDGTFYLTLDYAKANATGQVPLHDSTEHGFADTQGFAIGPDGTFYIGFTRRRNGDRITGVAKGRLDADSGRRVWSTIALTEPIPPGSKNHPHPGIVIEPAGRFVFLSSGSRTDHGEVADRNGTLPGVREVPLTAVILRLPTDAEDIIIPADAEELKASGYLFAEGFRNAFDMAFAGNGDLFAADNGPDSDQPEAISWVREGHHFGFPWRMGGVDNPMRFPDYDPGTDNYILFTASGARDQGLFYNDPDYPPPPMAFTDPIVNLGPDADRFRDPETGAVKDASDLGMVIQTLTPHSSPLGLVFDVENRLSREFKGDGFVLRTGGDCCALINSFNDPDEDLLHMDLEKKGANYQARITRIVSGFKGPVDAEIIGDKIYVIEWSGDRGLWEISLPQDVRTAVEMHTDAVPEMAGLSHNYPNPFNPYTTIEYGVRGFARVELAIFDLLGQNIRTLVDADQAPGRYARRWDGLMDNGIRAASGVYICRLKVGAYEQARRLTLLK